MIRTSLILAGAAALTACATTDAPGPVPTGETAIPFISSTGVLEWKVASADSLYIRGSNGDWYFVRTQECPRLRTAVSLGFETSAADQLDRFGAIRAEGMRCAVASVTRSGPPPENAGE